MACKDTHVVREKDLRNAIEHYIEKHQKRFPKMPGNDRYGAASFRSYGGISYIADQMTVNNGKRWKTNYQQIERIRKGYGELVSLSIADDILTAMGDIHLLNNEIEVFERPRQRTNKTSFKPVIA